MRTRRNTVSVATSIFLLKKSCVGHPTAIKKYDNLLSHFVATPQAFCELRAK